MTMPHLQNCPHNPDGWCLKCVGQLHAELQQLQRQQPSMPPGDVPDSPGEYEATLRYRIAPSPLGAAGSTSVITGKRRLWLQVWTADCGWMNLDIVGELPDGVTKPDKIRERTWNAIWRRVADLPKET